MAKRDVEESFLIIANQMHQMRELINSIEEIDDPIVAKNAQKNLEGIKKQAEGIRRNYEIFSQVMYLLNKPVRKEKQEDYARRESKVREMMGNYNSPEYIIEENHKGLEFLEDICQSKN